MIFSSFATERLALVVFVKTNLIGRSYRAYQSKRNDQLQLILHELEVLTKKINELQHLHRQLWFEWNKPFGYEIIDLRYGALKSRIVSHLSPYNAKEVLNF